MAWARTDQLSHLRYDIGGCQGILPVRIAWATRMTRHMQVRSEEHSTELSHGNACELVRRVAELVPPIHKVDLTNGKKTVLLILVCDACLLSVVDDYHVRAMAASSGLLLGASRLRRSSLTPFQALHRYNVHQAIQAMPKEQ